MPGERVGVIIPVYNRPQLVAQAIATVAGQTSPPAMLIVVDDGSTDATAAAVEAALARVPPPTTTALLRQDHGGVSRARNLGAGRADGCDLFAFLDSDDLWPADFLRRMTAALRAAPDAVAATGDRLDVDLTSGQSELTSRAALHGRVTTLIFCDDTPLPSCTVLRAAAFHAAGGYDPGLPCRNDLDFHLRLSLQGPWVYVPGEAVTIRRGTTEALGGAVHLTANKNWAKRLLRLQVLERFIAERGGAAAIPERDWRRRLARLWFRLGRELRQQGRAGEAAGCFRRAAELRPWHPRFQWSWRTCAGRAAARLPSSDLLIT